MADRWPRVHLSSLDIWRVSSLCSKLIRDSRTVKKVAIPKQNSLKPQDVAVALRLAEMPDAPYAALAADLLISPSTAHQSVERLQAAGLLRPDSRQANRHSLIEFLEHGVRYSFPARLERRARGVPTAYSGPPLANEILADEAIVWPDANGNAFGQSIAPLYPNAAKLPQTCPSVYELLTLVDAIRMGRSRERSIAIKKMKERLAPAA